MRKYVGGTVAATLASFFQIYSGGHLTAAQAVDVGCFQLTSIVNRAAETGTFYDELGNTTNGLARDLSDLEMDRYRQELSKLRQARNAATDNATRQQLDKQISRWIESQRALLRSKNCSSLMHSVGQQFADLVQQQGGPANLLGPAWLAPQGNGPGQLQANGRIKAIQDSIRNLGSASPWQEVGAGRVQEMCNNGAVVVGGWQNPNPRNSGHVAICAPNPGQKRRNPLVRDGNEHLVMDSTTLSPGSYGAIESTRAFGKKPTWYVWKPSYNPQRVCTPPQQTAASRETQPPPQPPAPRAPENTGGNSGAGSGGGGGIGAGTVAGLSAAAVGAGVGLYALSEAAKKAQCNTFETEANSKLNGIVNAGNALIACRTGSCQSQLNAVNSALSSLLTTLGNWCTCLGPNAAAELSAADRAEVRDAFNSLRSLGVNPGTLPSCFR